MARDPSSPGLPASSSSGWWCGPAGALHGSGDSSRDTVGAVAALDGSETAGNDDELITGRVENSPVSGAEVNDLGARIATDSSRRASSVGSTSGNCSGAGATASVAWPSTAAAPGSENRILGASARCANAARKLGLRAVANELVNGSRGATGSVAVNTGRIGGRSSHAARWTGAGAGGGAAAAMLDGAGSAPPRLHQATAHLPRSMRLLIRP